MSDVSIRPGLSAQCSEHLFKHDRPRRIDQYIDYFGGSTGASDGAVETVLGHDDE